LIQPHPFNFCFVFIPGGREKLGLVILAGAISLDGVRVGLGRIGVSGESGGSGRGGGRGWPCCCWWWARAFEGVREAAARAEEARPAVNEGRPADMREAMDVGRF